MPIFVSTIFYKSSIANYVPQKFTFRIKKWMLTYKANALKIPSDELNALAKHIHIYNNILFNLHLR